MSDTLTVSELFGPTLQGEGPASGRLAVFCRLGLCNLNCSWCDTPYTWDWKGELGVSQDRSLLTRMTVPEVRDRALELAGPHQPVLVITGGEPMVQAGKVMDLAHRWPYEVHIETNGTIPPHPEDQAVDLYVVSPKLLGSGVDPARAINEQVLHDFAVTGRAVFKFVIAGLDDLAQVVHLVEELGLSRSLVWLMPEGRTADVLAGKHRAVFDAAVVHGFNACTRLHVLAHDDTRCV